jgi:hypothetical protein
LPKKKVPPDKQNNSLSFTEELEKRFVTNEDETVETSNVLLPSNYDSKVSASNLKLELIGKSLTKKEESIAKKRKLKEEEFIESKVSKISAVQPNKKLSNDREDKNTVLPSPSRVSLSQDDTVQLLPPRSRGPPKLKPNTFAGPKEEQELIGAVKYLLAQSSQLSKPKIRFDISRSAALHNFSLLQDYDFNLHAILNEPQERSVTTYGSEFKQTFELQALFDKHPRWKQLENLLNHGSAWPVHQLEEKLQKSDLKGALKRGNHKSAKIQSEFLSTALVKEIKKGWELIIPKESAIHIPGLTLSPMGVAEHLGIDASGEFVPKMRLTHDLSFPGSESGESINSRVNKEELEPCMFGHTLLRLIHKIVQLRARFPNKIIWIRKEDAKSAYRRVHVNAKTAVQAAVQLNIDEKEYVLISLRLPFGGSPCPAEFCLVADLITDAINDLMNCEGWDPQDIKSDYVKMIPKEISLPCEIPFAKACKLSVPLEEEDTCKADVFIDDVITICVDIGNNLERVKAAPCTIMHAIAHKNTGKDYVPRQNFIAEDKNEAEGGPEELKIVLGWELNTRELLVKLPSHKFIAWTSQVKTFITRSSANGDDLRSVLGRLENVAIIIPMFGHFLNNIRQLEIKASRTNKNQIINKRAKEDFKLALLFLERASNGVSMNSIVFRAPNKIYINDASEHGLGGFATHGRAWRWIIPQKLRGRAHINLLEFIAQMISIWIDHIEGRLNPLDCLLGMGDNTASMGWLRRSNFRENEEHDLEWLAKQKIARKVAEIVLNSNTVLYRQWFKGADNVVADSLSRDAYFLSNKTHELFLNQTVPHQVPQNFRIQPVPKEICSFVTSTLLLLPVKQQRCLPQKPSDLARLNVGQLSSIASALKNCTSKTSQDSKLISSCQLLRKPCEKPPSLDQLEEIWWKGQSMPPSHMWHRPSGQTTGRTQDWTLTVKSALSSKSSSEDIAIKMAPDINSERFR